MVVNSDDEAEVLASLNNIAAAHFIIVLAITGKKEGWMEKIFGLMV